MQTFARCCVFVFVLVFGFANVALAQSLPIGTWKGTYNGSDTGTLTITIDANQKVTVDVYSNKYGQHFICTGGVFDLPDGSAEFAFDAANPTDQPVYWDFASDAFKPAAAITGQWSAIPAHSTTQDLGSFTANFVSGSTGGSTPIALGGYMSGNWYNPSQGGHGFQLEFTNQSTGSNTFDMLAIWFVYTPAGSTAGDGSGQNWIYAEGNYDTTSNTVTLPAILESGARFPPNFNSADVHRIGTGTNNLWGTLTFTFTDCNDGTVSWHSDVPGYNQANDTPLPIKRLTQIAGTTCPATQ